MRRKPLPQKTEADEVAQSQHERSQAIVRHYEFETYKGKTRRTAQPFLTVEFQKRISVSAGAARLFGTPDAVQLQFDKKNNFVALRPASLTAEYAFKIKPRAGSKASDAHGFSINAVGFCNEYGIGPEVSTRYPVEIYDGMLISDLNNPL